METLRSSAGRVHILLLVFLVFVTAGFSLIHPRIYEDFIPPVHLAESLGQDMVSLVLALPALILGVVLSRLGNPFGPAIEAGSFVYFLYIYLLYALGGVYNVLIPAYLAVCSLSLFGIIGRFRDDRGEHGGRFPAGDVASAIFFLASALILAVLWGFLVSAAVRNGISPEANAVICIDFIAVIPAFVATAVGLLSGKRRAGFPSLVLLTFSALLGASIVVGQIVVFIRFGRVPAGPLIFFSVFTAAALSLAIRQLFIYGKRSGKSGK